MQDGRCGHCGPVLLGALREAVGPAAQVTVCSCPRRARPDTVLSLTALTPDESDSRRAL